MKKSVRNRLAGVAFLFAMICAFLWNGQEIYAAENKLITLTFTDDSGKNYNVDVIAYEDAAYASGYGYKFSADILYVPMSGETGTLRVSSVTHGTGPVTVSECYYNENVYLQMGTTSYFNISLETNVTLDWASYIKIVPYRHVLSVDNLAISAGTKGNQRFHPSKNNYMIIRSNMQISIPSDKTADIRIRIYNSKNKYVYQKMVKNVSGNGLLNIKWNGKASKNNEAGVKATYVKAGNYKAEVAVIYNDPSVASVVAKKASFKVNKKAPSGTKGVAKAKAIVMYTGNPNVDYMAELMVKAAGVKSGMSADQKVKKIYHYMTTKFKHIHYGESGRKTYYNLTKLKSKISKFKTASDKKTKQGKLLYSYNVGWNTEYCMSTRSGVCDNHAQIFKILCNHVGVEASVCGGYYKNRNGSLAGHSWNSAIVNGKTYYYDVDIEIQNYGGGQGDYYWYKKTLKQAKKNHVFY